MTAFRTSARFGLIGVFVVAALTAAIALTMGQGQAKPKDALALIFGILAVFLILLFLFQTRDLSRAEAADADRAKLPPEAIENPAVLYEAQLFASMAIRPVDPAASRRERRPGARLGTASTPGCSCAS